MPSNASGGSIFALRRGIAGEGGVIWVVGTGWGVIDGVGAIMAISRFMAAVCSAIAAACSAMEFSSVERRELVMSDTPSIGVES